MNSKSKKQKEFRKALLKIILAFPIISKLWAEETLLRKMYASKTFLLTIHTEIKIRGAQSSFDYKRYVIQGCYQTST